MVLLLLFPSLHLVTTHQLNFRYSLLQYLLLLPIRALLILGTLTIYLLLITSTLLTGPYLNASVHLLINSGVLYSMCYLTVFRDMYQPTPPSLPNVFSTLDIFTLYLEKEAMLL